MRHKLIRKKLLRYLDDDLPGREHRAIKNHLQNCQSCQAYLRDIEALWRTTRPVKTFSAPPFLWSRISARLKTEKKQGSFVPLLRPALMIGALVLVLISGIKLGNMITLSHTDQIEALTGRIADSFGMSYFEVFPPGSIDTRFLTLTKSEMKK